MELIGQANVRLRTSDYYVLPVITQKKLIETRLIIRDGIVNTHDRGYFFLEWELPIPIYIYIYFIQPPKMFPEWILRSMCWQSHGHTTRKGAAQRDGNGVIRVRSIAFSFW